MCIRDRPKPGRRHAKRAKQQRHQAENGTNFDLAPAAHLKMMVNRAQDVYKRQASALSLPDARPTPMCA